MDKTMAPLRLETPKIRIFSRLISFWIWQFSFTCPRQSFQVLTQD